MMSGRAGLRNRVSTAATPSNSAARQVSIASDKKCENNPMQSSRRLGEQGLAHLSWTPVKPFDSSGKTPARWHHRNNRERSRRPRQGRLDTVARKPLIDI
jgi:hypothetical protein